MIDTKRQVLPSGLWIVATPIGNLEDITHRAELALREAPLILCEDTRRTGMMLSGLKISGGLRKLERLDAHTPPEKMGKWIDFLLEGNNIALVTDAGTPAVSDPGAVFVAQAIDADVRVVPLPGPSAPVALLSASGFHDTAFTFRGFFPRTDGSRKTELILASQSELASVFVWFEGPSRIQESIKILSELFPEARVAVAKELTKIYERFFYGTSLSVSEQVKNEISEQGSLGEWSFAVQFPRSEKKDRPDTLPEFPAKILKLLLQAGISSSEVSRIVSQEFNLPKKLCYEAALQASGKKNIKGG